MRQKHVPQRTCVACRRKGPKPEFVRVVLTADGEYLVDPPRRTSGRGAYLCRAYDCWRKGVKRGALDRALKGSGKQDSRAALMEWAGEEFKQQAVTRIQSQRLEAASSACCPGAETDGKRGAYGKTTRRGRQ